MHDLLDLLRQLEVLVGDALGGVILQSHLDPGVGRGDVRMVPRRLGQMTDGVDHHQRTLPAVGAVLAADPAVLEIPMRQVALERARRSPRPNRCALLVSAMDLPPSGNSAADCQRATA